MHLFYRYFFEVLLVKQYLTLIFFILSIIILIIGFQIDIQWNGIITWGLVFICLIFAVYFTKYIPNNKDRS